VPDPVALKTLCKRVRQTTILPYYAVTFDAIRTACKVEDFPQNSRDSLAKLASHAEASFAKSQDAPGLGRAQSALWSFAHWLQQSVSAQLEAQSDTMAQMLATKDPLPGETAVLSLEILATRYLYVTDPSLRSGFSESFLAVLLRALAQRPEDALASREVFVRMAQQMTPDERNTWLGLTLGELQVRPVGSGPWQAAMCAATFLLQVKFSGMS
jgi:hypothetical protein